MRLQAFKLLVVLSIAAALSACTSVQAVCITDSECADWARAHGLPIQ